jgi:hypothetical protein
MIKMGNLGISSEHGGRGALGVLGIAGHGSSGLYIASNLRDYTELEGEIRMIVSTRLATRIALSRDREMAVGLCAVERVIEAVVKGASEQLICLVSYAA